MRENARLAIGFHRPSRTATLNPVKSSNSQYSRRARANGAPRSTAEASSPSMGRAAGGSPFVVPL